ncbi:MAG TPA: beta-propeller fold lactonase family protein [Solirubrobacterales bacterium]|nr:beta-propeller fold lactonase family protein [Solirubrobacterales bacterium]
MLPRRLSILSLLALPLLAALFSGALAAAPASADGLRFLGCITGKLPPFGPRPGGCTTTPTAALDAQGAGLSHPRSLAASADGRSLYAVSPDDDSVITFRAKPLSFQSCFSANAGQPQRGEKPACKRLPGAGAEDSLSGFNGVKFVTVSPDGRSVYTVSGDYSLGIFARSIRSGKLTYKGCITGATGPNSTGKRRICRPIPTATPVHEGTDSGLGGPASLTVSPDSRFVYVAARGDAAVSTFAREADGSLSFRGCLTGGISATIVGFDSVCTQVAPTNSHGSGLRSVSRIVISPDGTSLYASAPRESSITEFQRDPVSGQLVYRGCLSGESRGLGPGNPCRPIPSAQEAGFDSGLWLVDGLALSSDGRYLYGVAKGDNAIARLSRDPATGTLTFLGTEPALDRPRSLAIAPDGRSLYVASARDAAILRLRRDPGSGDLSFTSCLTGRPEAARPAGRCTLVQGRGGAQQIGFGGLNSLAIAAGGLFAAAERESAISRFAIPGG